MVTNIQHHFDGKPFYLHHWTSKNFPWEERYVFKKEFEMVMLAGQILRRLDTSCMKNAVAIMLSRRYFLYDLSQPFTPQYDLNMRMMVRELAAIGH